MGNRPLTFDISKKMRVTTKSFQASIFYFSIIFVAGKFPYHYYSPKSSHGFKFLFYCFIICQMSRADPGLFRWEKDIIDFFGQTSSTQNLSTLWAFLEQKVILKKDFEEQHQIQEKIRELEKKKRKQRQRIFDVEDEITAKRDSLIAALERRMVQRTAIESLFTIRWSVI